MKVTITLLLALLPAATTAATQEGGVKQLSNEGTGGGTAGGGAAGGGITGRAVPGQMPVECGADRLEVVAVQPTAGRLGSTIAVEVEGLKECLAKWPAPKFQLHLDGVAIPSHTAALPPFGDNRLRFRLTETSSARETWAMLFGRHDAGVACAGRWCRKIAVTVSPGPGAQPYASRVTEFEFRGLSDESWRKWFALCVLLLALLVWAGISSGALRDWSPARNPAAGSRRSFSLARCQMAVWFYVVLCSYLLIWFATGEQATLTTGLLSLLGISAGTGAMAAAVDHTKANVNREKVLGVEQKIVALQQQLESPGLTEEAKAMLTASIRQLESERLALQAQLEPPKPQGFFEDLLTDANGFSFHRLQMATWTIVLVGIFIWTVSSTLVMPEFDETTLGLMGISSGAYVFLKVPEQAA